MPRKGDKYILTISLSYTLYLRLEERARELGKSKSEIVEEALKNYLSTATDGNAVYTIEPFVKPPRIREVPSSSVHPCRGCPSFRSSDSYCYALLKRVDSRECIEHQPSTCKRR